MVRSGPVWQKQQLVSDVYDCFSLCAAEKSGYDAVYASSDSIARCVCGWSDSSQLSSEEFLWAVRRMKAFSSVPVIAEVKHGFGRDPEVIADTVKRVARTGVDAVWIDDSRFQESGILMAESWEKLVNKAAEAVHTYPCKLICTTNAYLRNGEDDIARCKTAAKNGADFVGITGLRTISEAKKLADRVSVPKIWVETPEDSIKIKELEEMGYMLIMDRHSEAAAADGMELFGRKTLMDQHTVFHDQHDYDGMLPTKNYYDLFGFYKTWVPSEAEYYRQVEKI